ncbi:hypothetical protein EPN42_00015 [bacterium]|nr:MAG: hypothetical protein EPN42_00015 [bacterium]
MWRAPLGIALITALIAPPGTVSRPPRVAVAAPHPAIPRALPARPPLHVERPQVERSPAEAGSEKGAASPPTVRPLLHEPPHATPLPSPLIWHRMA